MYVTYDSGDIIVSIVFKNRRVEIKRIKCEGCEGRITTFMDMDIVSRGKEGGVRF